MVSEARKKYLAGLTSEQRAENIRTTAPGSAAGGVHRISSATGRSLETGEVMPGMDVGSAIEAQAARNEASKHSRSVAMGLHPGQQSQTGMIDLPSERSMWDKIKSRGSEMWNLMKDPSQIGAEASKGATWGRMSDVPVSKPAADLGMMAGFIGPSGSFSVTDDAIRVAAKGGMNWKQLVAKFGKKAVNDYFNKGMAKQGADAITTALPKVLGPNEAKGLKWAIKAGKASTASLIKRFGEQNVKKAMIEVSQENTKKVLDGLSKQGMNFLTGEPTEEMAKHAAGKAVREVQTTLTAEGGWKAAGLAGKRMVAAAKTTVGGAKVQTYFSRLLKAAKNPYVVAPLLVKLGVLGGISAPVGIAGMKAWASHNMAEAFDAMSWAAGEAADRDDQESYEMIMEIFKEATELGWSQRNLPIYNVIHASNLKKMGDKLVSDEKGKSMYERLAGEDVWSERDKEEEEAQAEKEASIQEQNEYREAQELDRREYFADQREADERRTQEERDYRAGEQAKKAELEQEKRDYWAAKDAADAAETAEEREYYSNLAEEKKSEYRRRGGLDFGIF